MQKNKVPFDYHSWKNHPERRKIKLVTRANDQVSYFNDVYVGRSKTDKPLIGLVEDRMCTWDLSGGFLGGTQCLHDLFMILPDEPDQPKEPELYSIMYMNDFKRVLLGPIAGSEDDAFSALEKSEVLVSSIIGTYKLVKQ